MILPDCMMPDGAEPCVGFQEMAEKCERKDDRIRELEAERDRLRDAVRKARASLRPDGASGPYIDAALRILAEALKGPTR